MKLIKEMIGCRTIGTSSKHDQSPENQNQNIIRPIFS